MIFIGLIGGKRQFDGYLPHQGGRVAMGKFKTALFRSTVSHAIFNHASEISSYGFTACNIALTIKEGVNPNLESAAGLLWLVSGACLRLAKKYPDLAFRLSGAGVIAGAALLSASGINHGDIDWWKTLSPIFGYGATGGLLFFQKEISDFADRYKNSPSKLVQAFRSIARYPVIASAVIDSIGCIGVFKSAYNHHQPMNEAIFSSYILADAALAASDPRVQEEFVKANSGCPKAAGISPQAG